MALQARANVHQRRLIHKARYPLPHACGFVLLAPSRCFATQPAQRTPRPSGAVMRRAVQHDGRRAARQPHAAPQPLFAVPVQANSPSSY